MMQAGSPSPLGATVRDNGVNFAVYSSVAERVQVCLFDADGSQTIAHDLPECSGDVWHGFIPGLAAGQQYGFRVHGPFQPDNGHFCDPDKLLLDPYAKAIAGELRWHSSLYGSGNGDSAGYVPKSVVVAPVQPPTAGPGTPWSESVIYEANVRGLTMQHPDVAVEFRGKFAGLSNAAVLQHICSIGVTSIELLPVHWFVDEHHLARKTLRNFWGYNSIGFFAPMQRYAGADPVQEFRDMVNAIHDAGLEVILDVVYNHTAEGDRNGPVLSFRGLDNLAYYRMERDHPGSFVNDTGCGNTLNADSPAVQRLVIDSLRYWAGEMGVDGFRFDLATVLGRHADGYSREHPLLNAIATDPLLRQRKLIAEPWDTGPGGYQVGNFPQGWAEWNDRYRDTARRFWRGDAQQSGDLARRLHGSSDLFEASGRNPSSSINIVTTHDGFTLRDLATYEQRHNEANGEKNRDGHAHNYSINFGIEGETDDAAINTLRRRHRLNLLATLFVSQGTPMLLAGDEFGNSQQGNNNAYAQDNECGWLDWSGLQEDPDFTATVQSLAALRRELPLLRLDQFIHGSAETDDGTVRFGWINPDGDPREDEDWWFGHAFGAWIAETRSGELHEAVALCFNAWSGELPFRLPELPSRADWRVRFCSAGSDVAINNTVLLLSGHSIAVATVAPKND